MDWVGSLARRVPWVAGGLALLVGTDAAAERVVFINLDAVALNSDSGQDPTVDSYSSNGFTPGTASGFALTEAERDLLEFYLKEATVPFDLQFVFQRPASGAYDMVVFGTQTDADNLFADNDCPSAIGLADCGDGSGQNISFVFQGCLPAVQQTDMRRIAYYALTGLGFGWGLENEVTQGQIMGTYSVFGLQFGDSCVDIIDATCADHPGCNSGQQNATTDLTTIIGAREDDGPPTVTITEPLDGAEVAPNFSVAADVADAFGGLTVTLNATIDGQQISQEVAEPPYSWDFNGVPSGTWTFDVEVVDADQSSVTSSVTVTVGEGGGGETSGGDDSGTTTTGGDPSGGGSDDTAEPPTTGDATVDPTVDPTDASTSGETATDGDDTSAPIDPTQPVSPAAFGEGGTGCQCTARGAGEPWGALGLLGLFALGLTGRRRRARTSTRPSPTSSRRGRTSR